MSRFKKMISNIAVGALGIATVQLAAPGVGHAEDLFDGHCASSKTHCQIGAFHARGGFFPSAKYTSCRSGHYVRVCVKKRGDVVYVKDTSPDGHSAVSEVERFDWSESNYWYCRNKEGYGTWVKCNSSWRENESYNLGTWTFEGSTGAWDNYSDLGDFDD